MLFGTSAAKARRVCLSTYTANHKEGWALVGLVVGLVAHMLVNELLLGLLFVTARQKLYTCYDNGQTLQRLCSDISLHFMTSM